MDQVLEEQYEAGQHRRNHLRHRVAIALPSLHPRMDMRPDGQVEKHPDVVFFNV